MSKTYTLSVNSDHEFKLNASDASKANIIRISKSKHHVLYNNKSTIAETIESNFRVKSYKVKINNNIYNINIKNDLDELIKEMGFEVGASKASLKRAFGKVSKGKVTSRILLNKFIQKVA